MYIYVNKQQSNINVLSTGWWEAARARHEGECVGGCLLDEGADVEDKGGVRFELWAANRQFNWVGKSSDFTNPFVCGPAGGKVKKMSAARVVLVCHICRQQYTSETYKILVILEPVQGG